MYTCECNDAYFYCTNKGIFNSIQQKKMQITQGNVTKAMMQLAPITHEGEVHEIPSVVEGCLPILHCMTISSCSIQINCR